MHNVCIAIRVHRWGKSGTRPAALRLRRRQEWAWSCQGFIQHRSDERGRRPEKEMDDDSTCWRCWEVAHGSCCGCDVTSAAAWEGGEQNAHGRARLQRTDTSAQSGSFGQRRTEGCAKASETIKKSCSSWFFVLDGSKAFHVIFILVVWGDWDMVFCGFLFF